MPRMTPNVATKLLGVQNDGRLSRCPDMKNCVCSQYPDDVGHYLEALSFQGTIEEGRHRLRSILQAMSQVRIVVEKGAYMRAEFTSKLFKFVDDVEFLIVPEDGKIHFRSASRLGYWDIGANGKRMEEIRRLFAKLEL